MIISWLLLCTACSCVKPGFHRTQRNNRHRFYRCVSCVRCVLFLRHLRVPSKKYARTLRHVRCVGCKLSLTADQYLLQSSLQTLFAMFAWTFANKLSMLFDWSSFPHNCQYLSLLGASMQWFLTLQTVILCVSLLYFLYYWTVHFYTVSTVLCVIYRIYNACMASLLNVPFCLLCVYKVAIFYEVQSLLCWAQTHSHSICLIYKTS